MPDAPAGSPNVIYNPVQTSVRSQKVDMLSTKNNDMKQRRVINAAPAVDDNDYVILSQLNDSVGQVQDQVNDLDTSVSGVATSILLVRSRYGLHTSRVATDPGLVNGALFVETDRTNIIYQAQNVAGAFKWVYVTGTMRSTISPDLRPTDLATSDTGFMYLATDTNVLYRWSGSAWTTQQQPFIINPVGGTVVDVQSRAAINQITASLRALGFIV